jgi:ORF6N domain-containing protein
MNSSPIEIPTERIEGMILLMRGQKVMLDSDLAKLYGVPTRRLNEQVRRNIKRFPSDFMFCLSEEEFLNLKSHFATSSGNWGGRRKLPYAFTEHGAVMLATILNSEAAIDASLYVVRAFVKLREMLATHKDLARKLDELERHVQGHDGHIQTLFEAIRQLMAPDPSKNRKIGFRNRL